MYVTNLSVYSKEYFNENKPSMTWLAHSRLQCVSILLTKTKQLLIYIYSATLTIVTFILNKCRVTILCQGHCNHHNYKKIKKVGHMFPIILTIYLLHTHTVLIKNPQYMEYNKWLLYNKL